MAKKPVKKIEPKHQEIDKELTALVKKFTKDARAIGKEHDMILDVAVKICEKTSKGE